MPLGVVICARNAELLQRTHVAYFHLVAKRVVACKSVPLVSLISSTALFVRVIVDRRVAAGSTFGRPGLSVDIWVREIVSVLFRVQRRRTVLLLKCLRALHQCQKLPHTCTYFCPILKNTGSGNEGTCTERSPFRWCKIATALTAVFIPLVSSSVRILAGLRSPSYVSEIKQSSMPPLCALDWMQK